MRISDWSPDVCSSDLSMFDVEMTGDGARIYVAKGDIAVAELSGRSLSELIPLKAGEAVNVRDGRLERTTIDPRAARWPASRLGFEERSEARRVGHECVSTCIFRGWPNH